jgi:hypothetical protein
LPSVRVITLGKEHRPGHRLRFFAECYVSGTRQKGRLCRVPLGTLGKESDMGTLPGGLFAECCQEDTRQRYLRCRVSPLTLGKAAVSVTRYRNGRFSLPSAPWHSANIVAECPRKSIRQRSLCRCTVCRTFFIECYTRQRLCRVLHSAKALPSVFKASPSARLIPVVLISTLQN